MNDSVEQLNEADTCRTYVVPALRVAGWEADPHSLVEQYTFTDGMIVIRGNKGKRREGKRADFLLRYTRDFPLAVVEAKAEGRPAAEGIEQAKEYAVILGLSFAYATNGLEIVEFDFLAGTEKTIPVYPTPAQLWDRLRASKPMSDANVSTLLTPSYHQAAEGSPRYYQEIAINRALQAILSGNSLVLLTLATDTGKSFIAFQIAWKLWSARWNRVGADRRPRILYLADRTVLVEDPMDKMFSPLGAARCKLEGQADMSREIYFSTYQALAGGAGRPGLFREFPSDFFDLVIVDEAHRGSAREDSDWRAILHHFAPAVQLGMTATPRRDDNVDTYTYFGNPVYTYSLKQGIQDGFLAPYRVYRIQTVYDAVGFRPDRGMRDRAGREIPDGLYTTKDFETVISLQARTEAIAKHLSDFLKSTDRFAKTMVFCADQEHALAMRQALVNENRDLVREFPDYVCRVTSDEGEVGKAHLSDFQEVDSRTPVILTTSRLLTTGVNAPTCKNVALVRPIESIVEFKQIIGRGTRVREDEGKLFFNILDYAGSASARFADPEFDGEPALLTEIEIDAHGQATQKRIVEAGTPYDPDADEETDTGGSGGTGGGGDRKYYVDGGFVQIASEVVQELDAEGRVLRVRQLTDYAADKVRTLYTSPEEVGRQWSNPAQRLEIEERLSERGIFLSELSEALGAGDADGLDILCHVAFGAPLLTRRQRADRLKRSKPDFFDRYGPTARAILDELLDKYADYGADQFKMPDVLRVPPLSSHGTVPEIMREFGGPENLREALQSLQLLLYAEAVA